MSPTIFAEEVSATNQTYEYIIDSELTDKIDFHFVLLKNLSGAQYELRLLTCLPDADYVDETVEIFGEVKTGTEDNINILLVDRINELLTKPYISFKFQVIITGSNDDVDFCAYYLKAIAN